MRPAMTLKNLFIAVFVLPLRISLILLLWAIVWVGQKAGEMVCLVDELIPRLEPDQTYEKRRADKRMQSVIDGMSKLAIKRHSS